MTKPLIAVVYLARKHDGLEAYRKFIRSYETFSAGVKHDLVVVFKGFTCKGDLENIKSEFCSLQFISLEVEDAGFDIGSYFNAAKIIDYQYICFLNTFSEILANDWLDKLLSQASIPEVGIVGATGSYEGLNTSITLIQKIIWLTSKLNANEHLLQQLKKYYDEYFKAVFGGLDLFNDKLSNMKRMKKRVRRFLGYCKGMITSSSLEERYLQWWSKTKNVGDVASFCAFPAFPNPHVRSNAFLIRRELFLSHASENINSKFDACHFESGNSSITSQLRKKDFKALVVNKEGKGYDILEWPSSNTFRCNSQNQLLVADNQTRFYQNADASTQQTLTMLTWGDAVFIPPNDFPNLGIPFKI